VQACGAGDGRGRWWRRQGRYSSFAAQQQLAAAAAAAVGWGGEPLRGGSGVSGGTELSYVRLSSGLSAALDASPVE